MTAAKPRLVCVDCPPGSTRPATRPGPRCATHKRERRNKTREAAWTRRLWDTYHITPEQYWALYDAQGGTCYLCRRATGKTKRLSVDHDHSCCPGPISCGKCVRGLLCSVDNKWLGHIRDEIDAGNRVVEYLTNPPAKKVLWTSNQQKP